MTPTEMLKGEHGLILRMLQVVRRETQFTRENGRLREDRVEAILDFILNYIDRLHHAKEENLLFARMAECGLSRHMGPIAVMLQEHAAGRSLAAAADSALRKVLGGEGAFAFNCAECLEAYATLLQSHIAKEDDMLYPWADRILDDADQAWLAGEFARADSAGPALAMRGKYERLVEELDSPCLIAPGAQAAGGSCGED